MPTLEDVLGASNSLEMTGASGPCGGLTMARDPATGRRAFRLVVEDTIEDTIALTRIDDVVLEFVEVIGLSEPGCGGSMICGVYEDDLQYAFGAPDGAPGQTRTYPPVHHDDGAIERLIDDCNCRTSNDQGQVQSMKFNVMVKFTERHQPPAEDRWSRCSFSICIDCEARTS
jgi:hypothetical protein